MFSLFNVFMLVLYACSELNIKTVHTLECLSPSAPSRRPCFPRQLCDQALGFLPETPGPALAGGARTSRATPALPPFFFFFLINIFLAALGLRSCVQVFSSCGERGYSSLWCMDFSLRWLLLLRSTGFRHMGFSSCGTRAQ